MDSTYSYQNTIDENYIPLFEHQLIAGKNFTSKTTDAEESEVIVSEQFLKRFNIENNNPSKAIGETILVDRKPMIIIGVVKDYVYGRSIDNEKHETIFRYSATKANYVNLQVTSTDWQSTFAKIEAAWKKIDTVHPLEARFYDDELALAYDDFSARIKIIGMLSFLAICIASIGLIGMVVFTTETRLKEISIRKILGATEANLIFLLSKGFLFLLIIAALIALPFTHFFFARFILAEYGNGAPNAFYELTFGIITIISLALLLIGSQTWKAARSNPAQVLKSE